MASKPNDIAQTGELAAPPPVVTEVVSIPKTRIASSKTTIKRKKAISTATRFSRKLRSQISTEVTVASSPLEPSDEVVKNIEPPGQPFEFAKVIPTKTNSNKQSGACFNWISV